MISAKSSEADSRHGRKFAQQLRSAKPEAIVDAYRELRLPGKGKCRSSCTIY